MAERSGAAQKRERTELVSKTLRVEGMFCAHCETRIAQALRALPGVREASADYVKGEADIVYDPREASVEAFRRTIEALGYEAATESGRYVQIVSILTILLAVYVVARHLGWTRVFNIFPVIETSLGLGALFAAGLLTSVHCIAMCGGINLTQSAVSAGGGSVAVSNLAYNAGRVLSYTLIGGLAGGIGGVFSVGGAARGMAAVLAGIVMLVMALQMLGVWKPLRKLRLRFPAGLYAAIAGRYKGRSSFVIGLLNGLMPCGPLQSMQLYALAAGSVRMGMLSMLLFALGTVPLMFGFGFFAGRLNRKYTGTMLVVSACLIFVMALHAIGNGLSLSGISLSLPRFGGAQTKMAMLEDGVQTVRTEVDYGSYEAITVRAGVPVIWTIVVPEGRLNGCNREILVPSYDLDIALTEGENVVSFTPEEAGSVPYSCWMGMIQSTIEVVG